MFLCMHVICCCPFGQVTLVNEILNLNKFLNKEMNVRWNNFMAVKGCFFSPRQSFTNYKHAMVRKMTQVLTQSKSKSKSQKQRQDAKPWQELREKQTTIAYSERIWKLSCKANATLFIECPCSLHAYVTSLFTPPPQRCHLIPKMSNIFNTNNHP